MGNQAYDAETAKCPYCGAGNSLDSEFCGACFKGLHIPAEFRAEARLKKAAAALYAPPGPEAGQEARPAAGAHPARLWLRLAVIAGLLLYYLQWHIHENYFSFLDYMNLAGHEAGHVFLGFMPQFIAFAGGTIFQLLIPAVCLVHLWRRGANLGWQLCLFWLGESLLNVSIYAGDAVNQVLPLVGGGEHDWNYMLTETGMLGHTAAVAGTIFWTGSAIIFYSVFLIWRDAAGREPIELGRGGGDGFF